MNCKAFRLHTNSYTFHDVQLPRDVLRENFHIVSTLHRQQAISKVTGEIVLAKADKECVESYTNDSLPPKANKTNAVGNTMDILHLGGQAHRFNNLIAPLVASWVPAVLYKFF